MTKVADTDQTEKTHPEPLSLEELIDNLRKKIWTVNWVTADALAQMGTDAVPSLLEALESENGYARNGAAIALGKIGKKEFAQPLLQALGWRDNRVYEDDEDREARESAATALGKLHDPALCEPLLVELESRMDSDSTLVSYIAEALGELGNPKAIPPLAKLVGHVDPDVQGAASFALARLGPDGIPTLCEILKEPSHSGRRYVVRALCAKDCAAALPILLAILENPKDDKFVRGEAARGLGRYGKSPEVYPALVRILENEKDEIRSSALQALGYLGNRDAFDLILSQLQDPELRYTAVMALGNLGDTRACELLVPMLKSGDHSLAFHAAKALGNIGCNQVLPTILSYLDGIKDSPIAGAYRANVEEALRLLRLKNIKNQ
jgi:HEAT repeat protein